MSEDVSEIERRIAAAAGKPVAKIEFPGGKSRKTVRAILNDGSKLFATVRRSEQRGQLEADILRTLGAAQAPAPALISFKDGLMLQQDVGEQRLTEAIAGPEAAPERHDLLSEAIDALEQGQAAIERSPLKRSIPKKGVEADWRHRLIQVPQSIGQMLGVETPELDIDPIADLISVRDDYCVKWDARPGNAMVGPDGKISWIDWDHMGRRNKIDDLAWLLGDEYVDLRPEEEALLLRRHIPDFRGRRPPQGALQYFYTFGTLHVCVRLELILGYRLRDKKWWDLENCIAKDKVGMTKDCCIALCQKGARWSASTWHLLPLAYWFRSVGDHIRQSLH